MCPNRFLKAALNFSMSARSGFKSRYALLRDCFTVSCFPFIIHKGAISYWANTTKALKANPERRMLIRTPRVKEFYKISVYIFRLKVAFEKYVPVNVLSYTVSTSANVNEIKIIKAPLS